ncbi:hypothetical protein BDZ97DRAFT_1435655 [Flammula alnicola]|nr:hypothetical protein BDZ97DRAFT_1435655 [Flammula alnicola]
MTGNSPLLCVRYIVRTPRLGCVPFVIATITFAVSHQHSQPTTFCSMDVRYGSAILANAPPSQLVTASVITQTSAQLLSFTTTSPSAFKEAAGKLDTSTRELLEHSVRRAVCGTANAAAQSAAKP